MPGSQLTLVFRETGDIEPQMFRLHIALFPIGTGSLCRWSLVLKGSTGVMNLLDANDLDGSRKHEICDFNEIRKNHLKIICEVANLRDDELVRFVQTIAAAEKIPTSEDGVFCRTWVINVLKSLKKNRMELYGDPKTIQKAVVRG